jgi:hypothetical protein
LTPIDTIVRAYHTFLEDDSRNGQVLEGSVDKLLLIDEPKEANGRFTRRAVTVWDPLFKMIHGENSGLEEAIP